MIASAGWYHRAGRACGPPTRGPISAARRTTACCSWRWATTELTVSSAAEGGPPGERPTVPGGGAGQHMLFFGGEPGIGRLFGAVDGHRGVLAVARRTDRPAGRARGSPGAPHAPPMSAPRCCCGAAGCWSPAPCSASWTASFTRITRWRWRRRSPHWSASRCESCGGARSSWRHGSCWRSCRRSPASGRSSCWTARRTGGPRCAGWCWSDR